MRVPTNRERLVATTEQGGNKHPSIYYYKLLPPFQRGFVMQTEFLSHEYFDFSRFALTSMRTRFGTTEWFVSDAHIMDDLTGLPDIVFQGPEESARAWIDSKTQ